MSQRVMKMLSKYSDNIEVYSIDESFLRFDGGFSEFRELGEEIRLAVTKGTGIPISLGFAPTKALSKVANKISKKFANTTNFVHVIDSDSLRIKALKWFPIEDVWGIGGQHAKRLKKQGVIKAYDFTMLPDEWVRKNMSVIGLRLKHELQGIPTLDLDVPTSKKNIATTRSFDKDYEKLVDLEERVSTYASICAEKLRRQKSYCTALMIFVHTNGFRKELEQYSRNIVVQLPFASNSSLEIVKNSLWGLRKIYK